MYHLGVNKEQRCIFQLLYVKVGLAVFLRVYLAATVYYSATGWQAKDTEVHTDMVNSSSRSHTLHTSLCR